MKPFGELFYNPVATALGWTLLHALWQGFAVVLPTALLLHGLRQRSSALRYNVGVSALAVQLLLSVVTFWFYYQPALSSPSVTTPAVMQSLPVRWSALVQPLPWHQQVGQFLEDHLSQFVFTYLVGVAVFTLRLLGGWVYLQRLSRTAVAGATAQLEELTGRLRAVLAIRSWVRVRESARIAVPMVVGVLKPVLLLPVGLVTHLSPREVEAVLAHELAHVKRHDYAVNLLQSVVEVLYFFHPALWWLSARVREEREHCCDDLAVRVCGGDGRTLAQALARVEELRLTQVSPTPALAMAFATQRQQLLHRVRRVLGVPTRPVISNGSLAGLTMATLLLVSVSVLAVQQRPGKSTSRVRPTQPQPTRKHTIDSRSEYGMAGNHRIRYVVWKGRKLPASQVARLQRQLDQVMAGQLNLDAVKPPDRDILLTIIEKNVAFDAGMKALSEGMAHINYTNIEANARANVPVNVNVALTGLDEVDSTRTMKTARVGLPPNHPMADSLKRMAAQRKMDSLMTAISSVMEQRKETMNRLSKEMADLAAQQYAKSERMIPLYHQAELTGQQARLAAEIARLSMQNDAKSRALLRQKEQQMKQFEQKMEGQMKQFERQMEKQRQQMEASSANQNRLSVLADSITQLYEPITAMSEQIGELSNQISEDAMRQAEEAMRMVENINVDVNVPVTVPMPRAPRVIRGSIGPARPPRPPKIANPVSPAAPVVAPAPAAAPKPARSASAPKPVPAAKPVLAPKSAPAAKSPKE